MDRPLNSPSYPGLVRIRGREKMKIVDLRKVQVIVQERATLLKFINSRFIAQYIGIYIPSSWEVEMFHASPV